MCEERDREEVPQDLDDWDSGQWEDVYFRTDVEREPDWNYDELAHLRWEEEMQVTRDLEIERKLRLQAERERHNQQILERAKQRRIERWKERKKAEQESKWKEPLTYRQCGVVLLVMLVLFCLAYC